MSTDARETLREFQSRLAEKLKAVETASATSSKLGIVAGGRRWLVELSQVSEVVTVAETTAIPWTQPWFIGVASVRGAIYGCVDFAAFAGVAEAMPKGETRLLLVHPRFGVNVALRIEQALGLRATTELTREPLDSQIQAWHVGQWRATNGDIWSEISMEKLVTQPAFLEAGL